MEKKSTEIELKEKLLGDEEVSQEILEQQELNREPRFSNAMKAASLKVEAASEMEARGLVPLEKINRTLRDHLTNPDIAKKAEIIEEHPMAYVRIRNESKNCVYSEKHFVK